MTATKTRPDPRATKVASADLRTYREDFGDATVDSQWFTAAYEYSSLDQHGISWELYWYEVRRLADTPALPDPTLTAEHTADGWRVRDAAGGIWYPDTTVEHIIESAGDQAAAVAVDICRRSPMRGTWHS